MDNKAAIFSPTADLSTVVSFLTIRLSLKVDVDGTEADWTQLLIHYPGGDLRLTANRFQTPDDDCARRILGMVNFVRTIQTSAEGNKIAIINRVKETK